MAVSAPQDDDLSMGEMSCGGVKGVQYRQTTAFQASQGGSERDGDAIATSESFVSVSWMYKAREKEEIKRKK